MLFSNMQKLLYIILGALGGTAIVVGAAQPYINSSQLAPSPVSGKILQTNGVSNSWVNAPASASTTLLTDNNNFQGQNTFSGATTTLTNGLSVAGASGLTVLANGKVGIGTTSPIEKLHVYSANNAYVRLESDINQSSGFQMYESVGGVPYGFSLFYDGASTNDFLIQSGIGTLTTKVQIKRDSGNFGIGGDPVSAKLYVNGNVGINNTTPYSKLSVVGSGTGDRKLVEFVDNASSTLFHVLESGNGYFKGNVGIGTTSPYAKLSVVGQTVAAYFTATTTATSTLPRLSSTLGNFTGLCIGGDCKAAWPTFASAASSTLLTDNNTWSGLNVFGSASTTNISFSGYIGFFEQTWRSLAEFVTYIKSLFSATYPIVYSSGVYSLSSDMATSTTYFRWSDKMSIPQATTTDETAKFGSCLESGDKSVTITKIDTLIASSTMANASAQGITWNLNIGNTTSSTSPMTAFTVNRNSYGTSSVQTFVPNGTATIPAGYCYWLTFGTASTSQIQMMYVNLWGNKN